MIDQPNMCIERYKELQRKWQEYLKEDKDVKTENRHSEKTIYQIRKEIIKRRKEVVDEQE